MKINYSNFFTGYINGNKIIPVGNSFDMGSLILHEIDFLLKEKVKKNTY